MSFYSRYPDYYDRVFPFRPVVFDFLASHLGAPGRSVLDIGCGVGRYVGRFAETGARALGVDIDAEMIAIAHERNEGGEFRQLDMADVATLDRRFDLVFSVGNVVSHVDESGLARLVRAVREVLHRGGCWVLQVVNWDHVLLADNYVFPPKDVGVDGLVFEREYRDVAETSVTFAVRLRRGDEVIFSDEVAMHPLRAAAIQRIHTTEGFRLRGHYGDFLKTPFDPELNSGNVMVFGRIEDRERSNGND